jgi:hypothetical protein
VRLTGFRLSDNHAGSKVNEIVRLLPEDRTGKPAYRIKSGPIERAVREFEIVASS